jgi:hypothetical protein
VDVYGRPVSLTYDKDAMVKSVIGGMTTILARLIIMVYFLFECKDVFDQSYTMQTSVIRRDFTRDSTKYHLNDKNFDFGLRVEYILSQFEPEV